MCEDQGCHKRVDRPAPVKPTPAELEHYIDLLEQSVFYLDRDLRCRFANLASRKWMCHGHIEAVGAFFQEILGEANWRQAKSYVEKVIGGVAASFYGYLSSGDDGFQKVKIQLIPDMRGSGQVDGFLAVFSGEAQLASVSEDLRTSFLELKLAQKIANIGNWSLDPEVGIPEWSDQIYVIYGRDPDKGPFSLADYARVFDGDNYRIFHSAIEGAINEGKPYDITLEYGGTGQTKWLHAICEPDPQPGPKGHMLRGTIQDITLVKQAEQQLIKAREAAEQATRMKNEFFAMVSHELRTPLNPIIGLADLLAQEIKEDELLEMVSIIQKSGKRLNSMITNILNVARIDSGSFKLNRKEESLKGFLTQVHSENLYKADRDKAIELDLVLDPDAVDHVETDFDLLHHILDNLLLNAFKFTESGKIVIRYTSAPSGSPGQVRCMVSVKDTGIGISPDKLDNIFDAFYQADSGLTRKYGGAGLGLTICHKMVKLLGGEISVHSRIGEGSDFTVTVPCEVG